MTNPRPTALVTGGTSGIGSEFARAFAARGYDLILTGRRHEILERLCVELEQTHGIRVGYVTGDLAETSHVNEITGIINRTPGLEILVNNAGYTRLEFYHKDDVEDQVNMLKVHDEAAVRLTHAAIPVLDRNAGGSLGFPAIINVSSIAAFQIGARNLMYDATKAFLLNFSESLHLILHATPVRVQALCPGFTRTDFHMKLGMGGDHPLFKKHKFMSARQVVDASLRCLVRDRVVCLPGWRNKINAFLSRLAPRRLLYYAYLKRRKLR